MADDVGCQSQNTCRYARWYSQRCDWSYNGRAIKLWKLWQHWYDKLSKKIKIYSLHSVIVISRAYNSLFHFWLFLKLMNSRWRNNKEDQRSYGWRMGSKLVRNTSVIKIDIANSHLSTNLNSMCSIYSFLLQACNYWKKFWK